MARTSDRRNLVTFAFWFAGVLALLGVCHVPLLIACALALFSATIGTWALSK